MCLVILHLEDFFLEDTGLTTGNFKNAYFRVVILGDTQSSTSSSTNVIL